MCTVRCHDTVGADSGVLTVRDGARSMAADKGVDRPDADTLVEMSDKINTGVIVRIEGKAANSEWVSWAGDESGGYTALGYADGAVITAEVYCEGGSSCSMPEVLVYSVCPTVFKGLAVSNGMLSMANEA